ncbi:MULTISPECIES: succinyl-diaminopimelate desuccinylase [Streptomyces]|uniref:Succinyl-diaminopimelate desuccinylase n=2 Tax=Streptomyces rimosus subsp. rimosus TaxID=132474 RepID=L8EJ19_STRR1|nr:MULTISPECIES: succinyl-diaminopimelate desuccinylase [Streptomyces]KOG79069.1 succinyl-diaminopimelate desuccinylase [Kitasatospora aureofaciens]MYT44308.1 succinyl-diaminopimelate desuccinylase [Streptomyces sp. SID5471]KEF04353.1 succinyl-diaminopimelate desuccinylase [Streptomyces rimosus]KOT40931.1 succinyl-diaminopimelate desuccinylase [Streptomyces rimosus subsp. rimosus]KOT41023.1 succinyl-diaminopimelate desuccinylase [Streptomyces sp. NRRL WC-3701]
MQPATQTPALDLSLDAAELTAQLVDIPSVSQDEKVLADAVENALRALPHLTVERDGNCVVARTHQGHAERVVLAGHLDTVPIAGNVPSRLDEDGVLWGCGTTDMKSGVAVQLRIAATVPAPNRDLTFVFYDAEEIAAEFNGLGRLAEKHPDWLAGDFAVLLEPSDTQVEGGCQGTLRVLLRTAGERAHSARSWMGSNAIHAAAPILARLAAYEPRRAVIDGLEYREGLNAVGIEGGVAGNVIPDACTVTVNFRYAPDRSAQDALDHVREVFADCGVTEMIVDDHSPGALPGLSHPAAVAFMAAVGGTAKPKFGWTDVSRFSALGVPAVNYGPGDALLAHKKDERVATDRIRHCEERLRAWLTA